MERIDSFKNLQLVPQINSVKIQYDKNKTIKTVNL